MILEVLLLLIGIVILVNFSNVTINRAARLSHLTGISQMAIGFIFVAVATSLPELSIGIVSSLKGTGLLSVGNLIGANVSNLLLVLGICSLFSLNMGKILRPQIELGIFMTSIIAAFLLMLGGADFIFGMFCLSIFFLFTSNIMKEGFVSDTERPFVKTWPIIVASFQLIVSVSAVILGAYIVTDSSIKIAGLFGVSESIIGATILAMGTTLPELSVCLAAVRKRNIPLAIGNIVGSIVTNMGLVFGIVVLLNPFVLDTGIYTALCMLLAANILIFILSIRMNFGIKHGLVLLSAYVIYLVVVFSGVSFW